MCDDKIVCIIPMAGRGSRAKAIFGNKPKYKMKIGCRSFLEYSMITLSKIENAQYIFICQKQELDIEFIEKCCRKHGIEDFKIITLKKLTDGQATTVFNAISQSTIRDEKVLIFNVDTYIPNLIVPETLYKFDGWISSFYTDIGDRWSFVKFNNNQILTSVEEKTKISNFGCTGVYYFSSYNIFKEIYIKYSSDIKKKYGETYISPMYKYMISSGKSVLVTQDENVIFLDDITGIDKKQFL